MVFMSKGKGLQGEAALVYRNGRSLTRADILSRAAALAATFKAGQPAVINLCEDRYQFLIGFMAALMARCRTVLPPAPLPEVVAAVEAETASPVRIDDAWVERHAGDRRRQRWAEPPSLPDDDFDAVVLYTSGSTGAHRAHLRRWHHLSKGADLTAQALGLNRESRLNFLATVPPQHMFGLETTILLPLLAGQAIDANKPLFPEDVRISLERLPRPRGLITTPLHLRTCLSSSVLWPAVDFVLSATAPLDRALAAEAEARLNGRVMEIYGSTETGALAVRRTSHEEAWRPLPSVTLAPDGGTWRAAGAHFPDCVLSDQIAMAPSGRFELLGRDADLIKVAGKRHSLAALSSILQSAPGVRDGVVLAPGHGLSERRLSALVVTDGERLDEVRAYLRERVDAAFMPRPIVRVEGLPRSASGKLPRQALETLLEQLES